VSHPLAKPEFDAVTGVSTGTLIAPFAFLGDEQSIKQILNMYRNPKKDSVKQRGYLYFLPDNISFAEVPGLEREIRKHITVDMLGRVAKAGADGRILLVNTTELDVGQPRVFDLVAEAQRAADSADLERVHNIMLASAGIPGAFPFRMTDGELYVDGGVTGNIIYGGRIAEEDSLPALWQQAYPNHPVLSFASGCFSITSSFRCLHWSRLTGRQSFNAAWRHPRSRLRRLRCAISSRWPRSHGSSATPMWRCVLFLFPATGFRPRRPRSIKRP
jgi:hypothetical protein